MKLIGHWFGMVGDFALHVRDTLGVPPVWALILLAIAVTAYVGAAAWAATVAEVRREDPGRHFLRGLLIPFVYPFVLLRLTPRPVFVPEAEAEKPQVRAKALAMPKMVRGVDRPGRVAADVAPAAGAETSVAPAATPALSATDVQPTYDEAYFRRLKEDSLVSVAAPCVVRYGGMEVEARIVVDVFPQNVTLEVRQAGGSVQRMRIPYAKIESVTLNAES